MVSIQLFLLMARLARGKRSLCSDPTGTTILTAIRTPWGVFALMAHKTRCSKIKSAWASFQDQWSKSSEKLTLWPSKPGLVGSASTKNLLSSCTALFCRSTTRNCSTFWTTKPKKNPLSLEKTSMREYLLKDSLSMWWRMSLTASSCWNAVSSHVSRGRHVQTSTHRVHTLFSNYLSNPHNLILKGCFSEES